MTAFISFSGEEMLIVSTSSASAPVTVAESSIVESVFKLGAVVEDGQMFTVTSMRGPQTVIKRSEKQALEGAQCWIMLKHKDFRQVSDIHFRKIALARCVLRHLCSAS